MRHVLLSGYSMPPDSVCEVDIPARPEERPFLPLWLALIVNVEGHTWDDVPAAEGNKASNFAPGAVCLRAVLHMTALLLGTGSKLLNL